MLYLDTNIVVALCVRERDSDRVEAAIAAIEEPLASSEWTRVEFTSALGIKVRNRELTVQQARQALANYYQAFVPGIEVLIPSSEDYVLAADLLQELTSGLRGGDALHLAIATNHKTTRLLTLDKAFIKAAQENGIAVELPW